MNRLIPALRRFRLRSLSQGLLVLGGILILAGLGWGAWERLKSPPVPTIGEEGAVVLAVTAPSQPVTKPTTASAPSPSATTLTPTLTPTPEPTETLPETPHTEGPTPDLLPDWTVTPSLPTPAPTPTLPATAVPSPSPSPSPAPRASEPPTRIVAPAIELDAKVVPMGWETFERKGTLVSEWNVPKKAAGWHLNSGLPGQGENIVLSGHHNIEGKVFRYVVDLEPGDTITLYVGDVPFTYLVSEKYILKEAGMPLAVRQKNAQWIMPTGDERLTLVTCWPYEWPGNTHRVIVVARPEDDSATLPEGSQ